MPAPSRQSAATGLSDRPLWGRAVLVTGPESWLSDRVVSEAIARVSPDACAEGGVAGEPTDIVEITGAALDRGTLLEAAGGSLLAARRLLIVRDLGAVDPDLTEQVLAMAKEPGHDCALLLVHGGGNKGKGLLDKLKKAKLEVVTCQAIKPWELPQFVTGEARRLGGRLEPDAATALVEAVGNDLGSLAGAVRQLLADCEEREVSREFVHRYYAGRAEVTSFAVADAALDGRAQEALTQLRWALTTGVAHVLVTSALAAGLRQLGQYLALRSTTLREAEIAAEIGVPPWKLKAVRARSRGWDQAGVADAILLVARADADVKGGAEDAEFALERTVLAIARTCRT